MARAGSGSGSGKAGSSSSSGSFEAVGRRPEASLSAIFQTQPSSDPSPRYWRLLAQRDSEGLLDDVSGRVAVVSQRGQHALEPRVAAAVELLERFNRITLL